MMRVCALFRHPSGRIGATIIILFLLAAGAGCARADAAQRLKQFPIDRLKGPNPAYRFGYRPDSVATR